MEQSLRQLQEELSIIDLGQTEAAGYLTYIKSRYPTRAAGDKKATQHSTEREEFEESLRCSSCAPFADTTYSQSDSSPDCHVSPERDQDPTEVRLSAISYSGSMFGSPVAILLDNFVLDCGDESKVDYGSYCPSVRNQVGSNGDSTIEVRKLQVSLLTKRPGLAVLPNSGVFSATKLRSICIEGHRGEIKNARGGYGTL